MSGHDLSNVAGFVISISSSKIVANTGDLQCAPFKQENTIPKVKTTNLLAILAKPFWCCSA